MSYVSNDKLIIAFSKCLFDRSGEMKEPFDSTDQCDQMAKWSFQYWVKNKN